jgi:hypothetical protein
MLPAFERVPLSTGAHRTRQDGMCAMEMVAWLADEPHSDEPVCSCPVLAAFVRACNDAMSDERRNRLLAPLVPRLVGSRGSAALERARGHVAIDGLVRVLLPRWLERQQRRQEAQLLRELPATLRHDDIRTAARAVEHFAKSQHASVWVLQRALEGTPPARYVAGIVQLLRRLGSEAAWTDAMAIVERMLAAEVEPHRAFVGAAN